MIVYCPDIIDRNMYTKSYPDLDDRLEKSLENVAVGENPRTTAM